MLAYHNASMFFQHAWNPWFKDLRKLGGEGLSVTLFVCVFFQVQLTYQICEVNPPTFSSFYSVPGIGCLLLRSEVHCHSAIQSRFAAVSSAEFQRSLHILLSVFWDLEIFEKISILFCPILFYFLNSIFLRILTLRHNIWGHLWFGRTHVHQSSVVLEFNTLNHITIIIYFYNQDTDSSRMITSF